MCFGKQPKIVMPQQPMMPALPPLPALQAPAMPAPPKPVPEPVNLKEDGSSADGGFKPRKKKKARGTESLRVPLNTGRGGINL